MCFVCLVEVGERKRAILTSQLDGRIVSRNKRKVSDDVADVSAVRTCWVVSIAVAVTITITITVAVGLTARLVKAGDVFAIGEGVVVVVYSVVTDLAIAITVTIAVTTSRDDILSLGTSTECEQSRQSCCDERSQQHT